jgi:hypothetical protein
MKRTTMRERVERYVAARRALGYLFAHSGELRRFARFADESGLLAKVYEVDVLRCPRCGSTMKVFAVITDPQQVRRVLRHLIKTGASPPGLDPASLA